MLFRCRSGASLLEMLIALVLLDLLAIATLHSVLATQRIARGVAAGAAIDMTRLETFRFAAADPGCRESPSATLRALSLAAHPHRPAMTVMFRCGR